MLDIIKQKFQEASDEMLRSIKEDNLTAEEKIECFGYLRGVRDCAYSANVLEGTTIQENLLYASNII